MTITLLAFLLLFVGACVIVVVAFLIGTSLREQECPHGCDGGINECVLCHGEAK